MPPPHPLSIKFNNQLTIDAGFWQEYVEEDQMPYRLLLPLKQLCIGGSSRI